MIALYHYQDNSKKGWENFIKNADINNESLVKIRNSKSSETVFHLYTNLNTDIQLKKIKAWNLDFFDKIVTSEDAGYEKPNKKFIEHVSSDLENFKKHLSYKAKITSEKIVSKSGRTLFCFEK